ncbi:hypothetical protein CAPTEDRAFT_218670 [Capitella teleta]|uniref:Uncharacterized protein n=1 Tax=Capitella teleta TaxID=283909 RepID=R7VLD0_CAPTE|nr:hypothetical protein CAPTEDRAFT_218670 [Capitella teleta]|eukprot:ELU18146.1 hypothetical protein CAPTEDRAFT_218670 [Capitella teleta]
MVWEYDLEGDALNGIVWELRHESNPPSEILRVDAQGQVTPQGNFPGASFTAPATLILNPMRMEDTGEITCTIYLKSQTVNDQVSTNIVAVDGESLRRELITFTYFWVVPCLNSDLKYVSINLTDDSHFTKDNKIWSIKYHVQISFDVLVESDSGAPMEVNAFQKCGEGQENQIGPECTKGSGNCTFETSAGCDGFTEGLVTIRATVKHPAFDEAKEATWSYNVEGFYISPVLGNLITYPTSNGSE